MRGFTNPLIPASHSIAWAGFKTGLNPPAPSGRLTNSVDVGVSKEVEMLAKQLILRIGYKSCQWTDPGLS